MMLTPTLFYGAETASFLTIPPTARGAAMGAHAVGARGLEALSQSPAGLADASGRGFEAGHADLGEDVRLNTAGVFIPAGKVKIGAGVTALSYGAIEGREADRRSVGQFTARETAAHIGAGVYLGRSQVGLALKALESRIGGSAARGVAMDAGVATPVTSHVTLGLNVKNLGPALTYEQARESLPVRIGAGVGVGVLNGFLIGVDVNHAPRRNATELVMGTEYNVASAMVLRGGYLSPVKGLASSGASEDRFSRFSAGMGLQLSRYALDYAYTPAAVHAAHRFSLSSRF